MGEHYTEREILIRISKIEVELTRKEQRIIDLEALGERYVQSEILYKDEIKRQNELIESLLQNHQLPLAEDTEGTFDLPPPPDDFLEQTTTPKAHHDLLVIGDSIIKHCSLENILPGKDAQLSCHPGAQTAKIESEFRKLSENNTYDRILIHCGINLVPQYSPTFASDKLVELMETVKQIAPKAKIAFSGLLPKGGPGYLPGINKINNAMFNASLNKHSNFALVQHRDYIVDRRGKIDSTVFCRTDGIHLSVKGVRALESSFKNFLSQ